MVLATHLERLVLGDRRAGLVEAALAREHLAGEDQGLGAGAALDQAALDQGDVEAARGGARAGRGGRHRGFG